MDTQPGVLLRIFVSETDKHDGVSLYEWLIDQANRNGLAGATATRGIAGYGAHHRVHSAKILRLSLELPVVVEIIDTEENVRRFADLVGPAILEGLISIEPVEFRIAKRT